MGKASRRKMNKHTQDVLARATEVIQSIPGLPKIRVRSDLPQEEKISNALSTILTAEVPEGAPLADYKTALDIIVIAWNISLLDADQHSSAIQKLITDIGMKDFTVNAEFQAHIKNLIIKKQLLFPHDNRVIVAWDVLFEGGNIRISASAVVPPGNG